MFVLNLDDASSTTDITLTGGKVGVGMTSPSYPLDVAGTIRDASAADASPYTNARIFVYGGPAVDTNNWGYLGYGSDANMRIVYSSTAQAHNLIFGTSSAVNNTGTFTPELTLAANGNLTMVGSTINAPGSASTYGAITVSGAKGGWGGINFNSGSGNMATLMVSGDTVGFYNAAVSGWDWYWTGGTLTAGTVPAANISAGTFGAGNYAITGDLTVGSGTGTEYLSVNGGTSGTTGGAALLVEDGGSAVLDIGAYSSIFGGAYNNMGSIYAPNGLYVNGNVGIDTATMTTTFNVGGGIYASGAITTGGNANIGSGIFATNGDHYMAWAGVWASSWLNQNVTTTASPSFGGLTINSGGLAVNAPATFASGSMGVNVITANATNANSNALYATNSNYGSYCYVGAQGGGCWLFPGLRRFNSGRFRPAPQKRYPATRDGGRSRRDYENRAGALSLEG